MSNLHNAGVDLFYGLTDDQVRKALDRAAQPTEEEILRKIVRRYYCYYWIFGLHLRMVVKIRYDAVDQSHQPATRYETIGIQFLDDIGKQLCQAICGLVANASPGNLRFACDDNTLVWGRVMDSLIQEVREIEGGMKLLKI